MRPHNEPLLLRRRRMVVATVILLTLTLAQMGFAEEIRAAGIVYCPYACDITEDGCEEFMIDVAKRAFAIAGYGSSVTMMPFARALQPVVEGKYDARAICNKSDVSEGGWACIFQTFRSRE